MLLDEPSPTTGAQAGWLRPRKRRLALVLERAVMAALIAALIALGIDVVSIQSSVAHQTERSVGAAQVADAYQQARFWVGQEEALQDRYQLEPSQPVLKAEDEAERNVGAFLTRVERLHPTNAVRHQIAQLLQTNARYAKDTDGMFAALEAGNVSLARHIDHAITDPVYSVLERNVYGSAASWTATSLQRSAALRSSEAHARRTDLLLLAIALALLICFALALALTRKAQNSRRATELRRLEELTITDPLTGLRNHRAFQEDLVVELQRAGRTGTPLSLVMLDADDLKTINDTCGHQVGDEALVELARTVSARLRATDRAYRVAGDEFAVILHGARAWQAFEFAQQLHRERSGEGTRYALTATAGIAEATGLRSRDDLLGEAALAVMNAKRFGQQVVIYTHEMEPFSESSAAAEEERQTRTLAKALALAVDSKDSYTRSHSQTVATLSAVIAAELGVDEDRLRRVRLAGLLHDVGKIGIPDSILKKPASLTEAEFEVMKTHTVLGENIVLAAEMPVEAEWIRHHHERIDGRGYPDGLSGEEIPIESRIIHVADAFEAMTSDRPYRLAPGEEFAREELRRNAGTQFDPDVVAALERVLGARDADVREPLLEHQLELAGAPAHVAG